MERSRKVLLKIASTSSKVVVAANVYADRQDLLIVHGSHFQLEEEMRKISVACRSVADSIGNTPVQDSPVVDESLKDWLQTTEPQMCFDTLEQMETLLLQQDVFSRAVSGTSRLGSRGSAMIKDKIDEAVSLLESRKGFFHFLFSTEIWNNEKSVQQRQTLLGSQERVAQVASNLPEQRFHVPDTNSTAPDAAAHGSNIVTPMHADEVNRGQINTQNSRNLGETLKWLDGWNCAEKQDITLSLRQPNTCEWLFDTVQYRMWRSGNTDPFLWLRGKPGAGKSVLASSVIESLEKSLREGEALAFFYCDFRNGRTTSASEAMRSILAQFLRQLHGNCVGSGSLLDDLAKGKERDGAIRDNPKELARFASRVAQLLNSNPWVVVDALDECKDTEALLESLDIIRGRTHLFVTSRSLQVIKDGLFGLPFLSMDDAVEELSADIELHVSRELDARRRLRQLDTDFKNKIHLVLCRKADGMFRWVQCSIETLSRCVTRREVQVALDSLPEGLDETYHQILLAIDTGTREGHRQLARRALIWLVAVLRPLRLDELMEGLSINLQTRTLESDFGPMHSGALLDVCGSLVTYTEKTGIVMLSHFSVKEYLMSESILTQLPWYYINWQSAHLHLARLCMCYLSICLKTSYRSGITSPKTTSVDCTIHFSPEPYPLRDYVTDQGILHFEHLDQNFSSILHDIRVLDSDIQQHAGMWDNLCLSAKEATEHTTTPKWPTSIHDFILYMLLAFAPNSLLHLHLCHTALSPKEGTNPLVYAASFNKVEHARTLLSRGARLNRKGWEVWGYDMALPIEIAVSYHYYAMVTLFVTEGSPVPSHVFAHACFGYGGTPYFISKLLLQTDDFAETASGLANYPITQPLVANPFRTFLRSTGTDDLEDAFIAIVRRFGQVGSVDLTCNNPHAEQVLHLAVEEGYHSLVQHLFALGIPLYPEIFGNLNRSGRWRMARMIHCLVENGANVLVHTSSGESVLHILLDIVGVDDEDLLQSVRLLIARGCNPLERDAYHGTPLRIAMERGFISVVKYILSTLHDGKSTSLARMTDLNCPLTSPKNGNSLLHEILLFSRGHEGFEMAKFLLEHGCNPLQLNFRHETPLHIAVEKGHVSLVRYLLSNIEVHALLPPDLVLRISRPFLHHSAWNKSESRLSMLRLLVEQKATVLAHTLMGDSTLHVVLRSFEDAHDALLATILLVENGCDPCEVGRYGETPLQIVARRKWFFVTQYLLSLGVPLPPDSLPRALHRYKRWDSFTGDQVAKLTRLLIDHGADVQARTQNGNSMLHAALQLLARSEEDHLLEVARLLVSHGCDYLEADSSGRPPLRVAFECGQFSVAQYFLSLPGASRDLPPDPLDMLKWSPEAAQMMCFLVENRVINASTRTSTGDSMLHILLSEKRTKESYALEAIDVLVSHGCDPHAANAAGQTPLHITIQYNDIRAAEHLLSLAGPLSLDILLVALEVVAMENSKSLLVRLLVEHGANVHVRTLTGDSLLHIVLRSFFGEEYVLETVKLLVRHGCDPIATNSNKQTPLHIALVHRHLYAARYILSLGITPAPDLLLTTMKANLGQPFIRCLVDNGADIHVRNLSGDSVLHVALWSLAADDALGTAKLLVGYGCDTKSANISGQTPLHIAVEHGHTSVIRYLIRDCGTPPSPDFFPLVLQSRLAECEKASIICCLIENGASVEARDCGEPPLHVALQSLTEEHWSREIAMQLISHGCDPHQVNSRGKTPLQIAIKRGHVSVARLLSESLGSPLPCDAFFMALNPEQYPSVSTRKLAMINFLADQGAGVHFRAPGGDTVFHRAVFALHNDEVLDGLALLVRYGCQPATFNANGLTPLHIAVQLGRTIVVTYLLSLNIAPLPPDILFTAIRETSVVKLEIVEALVTAGCDTCIHNALGHTPLYAAVTAGKAVVVKYLLSVMDDPSHEDLLFAIDLAPPDQQRDLNRSVRKRRTAMVDSRSGGCLLAKRAEYSDWMDYDA